MDDFWIWLKRKYFIESKILEVIKIKTNSVPEQLLIGYMMEYCNDHNIGFHIIDNVDIKQTYIYLKRRIEKK